MRVIHDERFAETGSQLDKLRLECEFQTGQSGSSDVRIRSFFTALNDTFDDHGTEDIFAEVFSRRPTLAAAHAAQLAVRAVQKQALRRASELHYPELYDQPEPWVRLLGSIAVDPAMRSEFMLDLATRNVQSNLAERYKTVKLLACMLQDRFEHPLRVLDIGCSENQGLKKLALNGMLGLCFTDVDVRKPRRSNLLHRTNELCTDARMTQHINAILTTGRFALGPSLGIDKEPTARRDVMEWIEACSFYPSELLDVRRREEFSMIEMSSPAAVDFKQIDIFDVACEQQLADVSSTRGPFDIVMYSTMQYQLSQEQRQLAPAIAERFVDQDNGLVISQEFATIDPADKTRLAFFEHWVPYTYRTVARDMRGSDELQQLFIWRDGRCEELQLGTGRLCAGNRLYTVGELAKLCVAAA